MLAASGILVLALRFVPYADTTTAVGGASRVDVSREARRDEQRRTAVTTRWLTASLVGMLAAALARSGVESGPKEGEKVAPLKVYAVTGDPKDQEVDYAGLRKDKPT